MVPGGFENCVKDCILGKFDQIEYLTPNLLMQNY